MCIKLLVIFWLSVTAAFGAAPNTPPGSVYYEVGNTSVNAGFSLGFILNPDGTYQDLFELSSNSFSNPGTEVVFDQLLLSAPPRDGTWTYRKLDENNAELDLILSGVGETLGTPRLLHFDTASSGTFSGGAAGGPRTGFFEFIPPASRQPLVNSSNRSFVPAGKTAQTGFVLTARFSRLLIRAVGPGLRPFGIVSPLSTPGIRIITAKGTFIENNGWGGRGAEFIRRTGTFVGAFPLAEASPDSAVIIALPAGQYTAEAWSPNSADSGEVLIEVYLLP